MAIIIMTVIVLQKYTFLLKLPNNSEKNCQKDKWLVVSEE